MYYLLGYKLFGSNDGDIFKSSGADDVEDGESEAGTSGSGKRKESIDDARKRLMESDHFAKGLIFHKLTESLVTKVIYFYFLF